MKFLIHIDSQYSSLTEKLTIEGSVPDAVKAWADRQDLQDGDVIYAIPLEHRAISRFHVSRAAAEIEAV